MAVQTAEDAAGVTDDTLSATPTALDPADQKAALKKQERETREAAKRARQEEVRAQQAAERAAREAAAVADDYARERYGDLAVNQRVKCLEDAKRIRLCECSRALIGTTVVVRARVHKSRLQGNRLCFLTFRQQNTIVQGLVAVDEEHVSKLMVKYAGSIALESVVLAECVLAAAPEPIQSATIPDIELHIFRLYVISKAEPKLPLLLEDAAKPESAEDGSVGLDTRLNARVIDLRTRANQAIFAMQAGIGRLFRNYLDSRGFMEAHTPKMIATASEGGANVFKINYFKGDAFLAQSPQLYKQMLIAADFERVYEIAPVFRAENSLTHRHMTEFTGVDLEMAFEVHYHEVMDLIEQMLVHIFLGLQKEYQSELAAVKRQYPVPDFEIPVDGKVPRLTYKEGIQLLRDDGMIIEDDLADLDTPTEKRLGRLVKEIYKTDFYTMDKFPLAIRPFYTMPDPEDPQYSNSYDFYMRGEEIMSGAQRIHDAQLLEQRILESKVETNGLEDYIAAFKYGAPPHAGGGIGLERVLMLFLGLKNIRRASLFPRDPRRLRP